MIGLKTKTDRPMTRLELILLMPRLVWHVITKMWKNQARVNIQQ